MHMKIQESDHRWRRAYWGDEKWSGCIGKMDGNVSSLVGQEKRRMGKIGTEWGGLTYLQSAGSRGMPGRDRACL